MARIVITGANRGIGFEFAKQLKAQGNDVTAVCRKHSAQLDALGVTVHDGVDLSDSNSLIELAKKFPAQSIDILINNAGVLIGDRYGAVDVSNIERQIQVNAIGPFVLTQALDAALAEGGKVVMITSRMGSMGDNTSGGQYGYRMSKAAMNASAVSLSHDLRDRGIAVGVLHPGYVATEMVGGRGDISPEDAAARLIQRIEELNLDLSGEFLHASGDFLPW